MPIYETEELKTGQGNLRPGSPSPSLPLPQDLLLPESPIHSISPSGPVVLGAFRGPLRVSTKSQSWEQCEHLCSLSSWNSLHWNQERLKAEMVLMIAPFFKKSPRHIFLPRCGHRWPHAGWFSGYLNMISYFPRFFSCRGCFTSSRTLTVPKSRPPSAPAEARAGMGRISGRGNKRQGDFLLHVMWKSHGDNFREFAFWKHHG